MYGCNDGSCEISLEVLMPKGSNMYKSIVKKNGKKKGKGLYYALQRTMKKKKNKK